MSHDRRLLTPKNVLVVRDDRIGDVVLTLPVAKLLKEAIPGVRVTFLVREYTKPVAEASAYIDAVITGEEIGLYKSLSSAARTIRTYQFDAGILVRPTFRTSYLLAASLLPIRVGTAYRWYSFLFNRKSRIRRKNGSRHEAEYNAELLEAMDVFAVPERSPAAYGLLSTIIPGSAASAKPLVILHPGSGGSAVDVSAGGFRKLAELLLQGGRCEVAVTGSKSEAPLCESVAAGLRIENYAGKLSLSGLMKLIAGAGVFVANSTGPLHLAAALGTFSVGFFPKVPSMNAARWGPYTTMCKVFEPDCGRSECTLEQCQRENCMNSIDMALVYQSIDATITTILKTGEEL